MAERSKAPDPGLLLSCFFSTPQHDLTNGNRHELLLSYYKSSAWLSTILWYGNSRPDDISPRKPACPFKTTEAADCSADRISSRWVVVSLVLGELFVLTSRLLHRQLHLRIIQPVWFALGLRWRIHTIFRSGGEDYRSVVKCRGQTVFRVRWWVWSL